MLNALPLEYLSPGDGVRCLSGLFSLLVGSVCDTPREAPPVLLRPLSHLIKVIVDSQSRCSFIHLLGSGVLVSWCDHFVGWLQSLVTINFNTIIGHCWIPVLKYSFIYSFIGILC